MGGDPIPGPLDLLRELYEEFKIKDIEPYHFNPRAHIRRPRS